MFITYARTNRQPDHSKICLRDELDRWSLDGSDSSIPGNNSQVPCPINETHAAELYAPAILFLGGVNEGRWEAGHRLHVEAAGELGQMRARCVKTEEVYVRQASSQVP